MSSENIERLIEDKSFRNWVLRSNQDDFEKWEALLERDPHLMEIAREAKAVVLMTEFAEEGISKEENEEALQRLHETIEKNEQPAYAIQTHTSAPARKITWFRYAAAILLLIGAGMTYVGVTFYKNQTAATQREEVTHVTQSGQFLTLRLADGSEIKLNSNTTVHLSKDFLSDRTVRLQGEAFFEVAKNKQLPFRVITENFTVEVVGTSFNINSDKVRPAKVSVRSGIVKVQADKDPQNILTLTKQQAVIFDESAHALTSAPFDPDEFLWKDGVLVFRDDDIEAIATKLERWYGVTIEISHPEKIKGAFNGTYEREGLHNMLEGMSDILNFSYQIDSTKRKLTITPN